MATTLIAAYTQLYPEFTNSQCVRATHPTTEVIVTEFANSATITTKDGIELWIFSERVFTESTQVCAPTDESADLKQYAHAISQGDIWIQGGVHFVDVTTGRTDAVLCRGAAMRYLATNNIKYIAC